MRKSLSKRRSMVGEGLARTDSSEKRERGGVTLEDGQDLALLFGKID